MTNQMTELVLRGADTSSDLKRITYKLSKEDKQRLLEEVKKFKGLEVTPTHFQVIQGFELAPIAPRLIAKPTFHITIPSDVADFVMFDKERVFIIEARAREVDWKTFQLVGIPSPRRGPPELQAFERERQAFLRIKDSLLDNPQFRGKFVAIYRGGIVDHDEDNLELARRVYSEHGYVPIYIGKIERERRVIEMPSPEGA